MVKHASSYALADREQGQNAVLHSRCGRLCLGRFLWYTSRAIECDNGSEYPIPGGLYYKTGITIAGFQSRVGCLFFLVRVMPSTRCGLHCHD